MGRGRTRRSGTGGRDEPTTRPRSPRRGFPPPESSPPVGGGPLVPQNDIARRWPSEAEGANAAGGTVSVYRCRPQPRLDSAGLAPQCWTAGRVLVPEPCEILEGPHVVGSRPDPDRHVNDGQERAIVRLSVLVDEATDSFDDHVDARRIGVLAAPVLAGAR